MQIQRMLSIGLISVIWAVTLSHAGPAGAESAPDEGKRKRADVEVMDGAMPAAKPWDAPHV